MAVVFSLDINKLEDKILYLIEWIQSLEERIEVLENGRNL